MEKTMAYDEGIAQILRDSLSDTDGIVENKMFGGNAFMLNGNMLCGVHKNGGMVEVTDEYIADDAFREALLTLARQFVGALPPK